jgi:alpha-galactosidase
MLREARHRCAVSVDPALVRSGSGLLRKAIALALLATLWLTSSASNAEIAPSQVELDMAQTWTNENLLSSTRLPPFSFNYGLLPSATFLKTWTRQITTVAGWASNKSTITWTNPENTFQVRCEVVKYRFHPAVEWTVYLKNIGASNSPICSNILGFDTSLSRTTRSEYVLHGIKGDFTTADSYEPYHRTMGLAYSKTYAPFSYSGKSSDGPDGFPYFNLQMPGGGIVMAIGWPGQWSCKFTRVGLTGLTIQAGQQLTRMYLQPGEEIRTPLTALVFWRGEDVERSQNLWRHWYLDHVLPVTNGTPAQPVTQIQVSGYDVSNLYAFLTFGITPDICWRDAGWYPTSQGPYTGNLAWLNTGTWEIDRTRYPRGFRNFSNFARDNGSSFLLWFEPERVGSPNSFLGNRPQWLLPETGTTVGDILNLGNPEALDWLINHYSNMITTEGIDWYREDMNGDGPLPAWRAVDTTTRQGITENLYVQGHLKFWDELRARHPGLHIDSCASGGRRNDLETMRRAVPLLRSDFQFTSMAGVVDGNQCHTYGLSSWLPFAGTASFFYDEYSFRSFYAPGLFGFTGGINSSNSAIQIQGYGEYKEIGKYLVYGDYHPLTPYSLANNVWIAWQFNSPSEDAGCVQIFRRQSASAASMTFKLKGLDPLKTYQVRDFEQSGTTNYTGAALMNTGVTVALPAQGSTILKYQAVTAVVPAPEVPTRGPYRPSSRPKF